MKSYCKGLVIDRTHVAHAYETWMKATAGHKNAWRVDEEYGSAEALIDEIVEEIAERRLAFRPIHRWRHREPTNGKIRIIGVESVKQQVVDYVVVTAIRPLLEAKLGFWQTAGVKGRGQSVCRRAMRRWVREGGYHVKVDVRKCYPSISHDVVRRILRRFVRSADVLYCADALLATYDLGGLEIGSNFALQMANLVLSFAYHHLEGLGRERRGKWVPLISHQLWHLDDGLLLSRDKRSLKMAVRSLARYLSTEFGLEIKPWKVARTSKTEPLDLGGFRVSEGRCTLRPTIFLRAKRAFSRFSRHRTLRRAQRVVSYWGWLANSDTDGFILRNGLNREFRIARRIVSRAGRAEAWNRQLAPQS